MSIFNENSTFIYRKMDLFSELFTKWKNYITKRRECLVFLGVSSIILIRQRLMHIHNEVYLLLHKLI
jgi:hypothetical protein